ncbi:MAG: hypothetical protein MMC33_005625 [Icmadophila ericetorum]|nr:hypothetical protein [Icmadophila ericetorum]
MTEPEELDEDLFADLYDGDEAAPNATSHVETHQTIETPEVSVAITNGTNGDGVHQDTKYDTQHDTPDQRMQSSSGNAEESGVGWQNGQNGVDNGNDFDNMAVEQESHGTGIKEDGKMFIGGLNWETTDQSLRDYFSQYGEVQECTVMRDGATGRSRGFGFLTFKDARTVNIVMVKEHYLDGKIIDPKRAIPRDEQERTSKIFVGGVSQDATDQDFREYFAQYGRVVDATLMMDKDTGRPRGFGFVTFDSEAAVDATLAGDLMILGKPIEVKKAQPRGNMRDGEEEGSGASGRRGGRRGGKDNDRFRDNDRGNFDGNTNQQNNGMQNQAQNQQGQGMYPTGMTPQMMAQYWQRMQQYFQQLQQQMAAMAANGGGGMNPAMGMGAMNPAMMQQFNQMKQIQQMQAMQQQMNRQQGSQSPHPQSPNSAMASMAGMAGMNPAMMQQMQQMQQMQMQAQQTQGGGGFGNGMNGAQAMVPTPGAPAGAAMNNNFGPGPGGRRGTPGYNAQEQLLFEQQKYEQQQARRAAQEAQQMQYNQNGPNNWEGMYDDVPPPNMGGGGGGGGGVRGGGYGRNTSQGPGSNNGRGGRQQDNRGSQGPQSAPPANAPTGPKNAGVPGANYRGGGRGGHRGGFHPYARK